MKLELSIAVMNLDGEVEYYPKALSAKSSGTEALKKALAKIVAEGVLVMTDGVPTKYYPGHQIQKITIRKV